MYPLAGSLIGTPDCVPVRRSPLDDAVKASSAGAVAKSGSNEALAAASAKQSSMVPSSTLDRLKHVGLHLFAWSR